MLVTILMILAMIIGTTGLDRFAYPFSVRVIERLQLHNVGMTDNPHDL